MCRFGQNKKKLFCFAQFCFLTHNTQFKDRPYSLPVSFSTCTRGLKIACTLYTPHVFVRIRRYMYISMCVCVFNVCVPLCICVFIYPLFIQKTSYPPFNSKHSYWTGLPPLPLPSARLSLPAYAAGRSVTRASTN